MKETLRSGEKGPLRAPSSLRSAWRERIAMAATSSLKTQEVGPRRRGRRAGEGRVGRGRKDDRHTSWEGSWSDCGTTA